MNQRRCRAASGKQTAAPARPAPRGLGTPSSVTIIVSVSGVRPSRSQVFRAFKFRHGRFVRANLRAAGAGTKRAGFDAFTTSSALWSGAALRTPFSLPVVVGSKSVRAYR
jgi:hypothetical protein